MRVKEIWNKILPIPIGTRVRYVRRLCRCKYCYLVKHFGEEGIIIEYLGKNNHRKTTILDWEEWFRNLKETSYPDLSRDETLYLVRFGEDPNEQFPLRRVEMEVIV